MRINSPYITGSATITGNLCVQGTILGTITGVASTASYSETLDGLDSTQFVQTGSFNSYTSSASSSIGSLSGSVATTTSGLSSSIGSLSSSVATTTSGLGGRITTIEGRYATTGSNIFVGSQVITGSLYITNDMVVQGCSCLQNITASAVSIGTNTVVLNTATPALRFAGVSVQDSGSNAGVTGSIFWDGLCNRWVYSNPSGIGYSGGMLLSGPRTSTLGTESPLTCNYIAKSGGGDHLYDSCIIDDGTTVCINANLKGSGISCFAGTVCVTGNADTAAGLVINNPIGASGTCQHYINFTAGGTTIGKMFRGNGIAGVNSNGLTIDNFDGMNIRLNQLGGSAGFLGISGGVTCFTCQVCAPLFTGGIINGTTVCTSSGIIGNNSNNLYLSSNSATGEISFWGNQLNTRLITITGCGCMGIGTSTPISSLQICAADGQFRLSGGDGRAQMILGTANKTWQFETSCGTGNVPPGGIGIIEAGSGTKFQISAGGVACFQNTVCAPSLSIGSTTNSTNPSVGSIISAGGLGLGGDIFMHPYNANQSNYGYIKTAATTVNTTTLTLGTTYGYATNVDAVSFFNGSATFNSSVTLSNSVFPVLTVQGTASSPHIGSTWSVSANQDGIGRTIIGTACQGRVMYFENSGDINIPNNTLTVGKSITSSGNSLTYKTGGGGTAKQVIAGQTTATTSGVAKKVAYVGHTHSLVIYVWATQSTSSGVSVIANMTTSYGASSGGVTYSSGAMGTVSAVAVSYNNGGSPGYTIDITVTYSGAAPTINYVIEGISHDNAIYTL